MNFYLFKPEKEKLFVLISITLNANSIAPKVSFEPSFVYMTCESLKLFKHFRKSV